MNQPLEEQLARLRARSFAWPIPRVCQGRHGVRHPFNSANTYVKRNGGLQCAVCHSVKILKRTGTNQAFWPKSREGDSLADIIERERLASKPQLRMQSPGMDFFSRARKVSPDSKEALISLLKSALEILEGWQ